MTTERKRLVIAIDCDDVLVPTAHAIVADYKRRFGVQVHLRDFYQSASLKTWGTDNDDEAIERVNQFLRSKEHAELAPFPEAVMAVRALARDHELHLVSGRIDFLRPATERMLDAYFPGYFHSIEHTNFIAPSHSEVVKRSKGEVCRTLGADILIDDHIHHGTEALDARIGRAILFGNYPWSQGGVLPKHMVRCEEWPQVIQEVESYAAG